MCHGYRNLTSADRKITSISQSLLCDNTLVFGWYRFKGDAGARMAAACPNFSLGRCGTLHQGWLNGTHPKAEDGEVVRKVCFMFTTCCSQTISIKVKNCGSYYVYRLQPPPACQYRYCGTDWTKLKHMTPSTSQFFPPPPLITSSYTCPRLVECWSFTVMSAINSTSRSASRQQAENSYSVFLNTVQTVTNWGYHPIGQSSGIFFLFWPWYIKEQEVQELK